jgi:hypothetical protein
MQPPYLYLHVWLVNIIHNISSIDGPMEGKVGLRGSKLSQRLCAFGLASRSELTECAV